MLRQAQHEDFLYPHPELVEGRSRKHRRWFALDGPGKPGHDK
jgi:hypothetical protein